MLAAFAPAPQGKSYGYIFYVYIIFGSSNNDVFEYHMPQLSLLILV